LPSGRRSPTPQPCIRSIRVCGSHHDAVMRIVGEAPGRRGPIFTAAFEAMGFTSGHRHLGFAGQSPLSWGAGCQTVRPIVALLPSVVHDAGRNTTPCGTSPLVTNRQRAMSSLRASATIIVLRVLARPSAVRAANHWARALFFWNLTKRQASWIRCGRGHCQPAQDPVRVDGCRSRRASQ
jgi:hypothetical protein